MSDGVPITELHCPTCGRQYDQPLKAQQDRDPLDTITLFGGSRHYIQPPPPWYIECPRGHRWTLKTHFWREGEPEALLLGEYIGSS